MKTSEGNLQKIVIEYCFYPTFVFSHHGWWMENTMRWNILSQIIEDPLTLLSKLHIWSVTVSEYSLTVFMFNIMKMSFFFKRMEKILMPFRTGLPPNVGEKM